MSAQKIQFGMWPGGEGTGTGAPAWRSDPRGDYRFTDVAEPVTGAVLHHPAGQDSRRRRTSRVYLCDALARVEMPQS